MAFAQLAYRESLRDIEACLRAQRSELYHLGIRSLEARNTLANASAVCKWRIYADFLERLVVVAQRLYADEPFGVDLKESVYALARTSKTHCDAFVSDPASGKTLTFLTSNFTQPALTITQLYCCRWQVEIFFKRIEQHLRIKAFFSTSQNAVKSQIGIAVSVYVLVAIVKKRLKLTASLYEMLQRPSLTTFEKIPLEQFLAQVVRNDIERDDPNQLILFE